MSLINREALIAEYDRVYIAPGIARKLMEDAPTVEPERKKGKWIVVDADIAENSDICECNQCRGRIWKYKNVEDMWNYCPRCGADMREGEQDGQT